MLATVVVAALIGAGLQALPAAAAGAAAKGPDGSGQNDPARESTGGRSAARRTRPAATLVEGSYLVRFVDGADAPVAAAAVARHGAVQRTIRHVFDGALVRTSPEGAEALRHDPRVASVEQDQVVSASGTQVNAPWGLDRSDQRHRPLSTTFTPAGYGSGVTAYVLDSGIRADHTDFGGRVRNGTTVINDGNGMYDCDGHGTHLAGTIGGATYGMAKLVSLVNVRVLDCNGDGTVGGIVAGLDWVAADHAAGQPAVVNLSLGAAASPYMDAAVNMVIADGVTVVAAAGNEEDDACFYSPARVPGVITVGATDSTDYSPNFSNVGPCLDLFAPGVAITSTSTWSTTATATYTGTSMASPHVAGAAALLLGAQPSASPAAIAQQIVTNATPGLVGNSAPELGTPNRLLFAPPDPPPNDNFLAATMFDVIGQPWRTGSTVAGTREPGEPWHAGQAGGSSAWWVFIAPADGTVALSTYGSTFDTLLGVYQGSSVNALTMVASSDNAGGTWSAVSLHVNAGHAYRLAVDGYQGAAGDVVLGFTFKPDGAFIDVPLSHPFYPDIKWAATAGIVSGFSDGYFRPSSPVSRQAMAAFLYRYAGAPLGPSPTCTVAPFSDVPVGTPFCGQITWLVSQGYATGFPNGTFDPLGPVSRQATAAFLYRLTGSPLGAAPPCPVGPFGDVPVGAPFCGEITWLVQQEIAAGYADGAFRPALSVSRQAMAAFLHRLAT